MINTEVRQLCEHSDLNTKDDAEWKLKLSRVSRSKGRRSGTATRLHSTKVTVTLSGELNFPSSSPIGVAHAPCHAPTPHRCQLLISQDGITIQRILDLHNYELYISRSRSLLHHRSIINIKILKDWRIPHQDTTIQLDSVINNHLSPCHRLGVI